MDVQEMFLDNVYSYTVEPLEGEMTREEALTAEEIIIEKFTKKGEPKRVNIAEGMRFESAALEGSVLTVTAKLSCDDASFVNPKYIGETLTCAMPEVFTGAEEETCRMAVYLADGETLFK